MNRHDGCILIIIGTLLVISWAVIAINNSVKETHKLLANILSVEVVEE